MSKSYSIVDTSGTVTNVIVWDGEVDYTPPDGCIAVQSNTAAIGWTYANGVFTPPPEDAPSE